MLDILYHNRNLLAVTAAVVIGAFAFHVMPITAADLSQVVTMAGAPHGTGSQNPFLDAAAQQNAGYALSAHPALAQNLR